jgi:hypothetical protein
VERGFASDERGIPPAKALASRVTHAIASFYMKRNLRTVSAVLVGFVVAVAGCSRSGVLPDLDAGGASHAVATGSGQQAAAGTELPAPVTVKVLDIAGRPVSNQIVNFVVTRGGGHVYSGRAITDADGLARDWWTLGPTAGANALEARAVDSSTGEALVFGRFEAEAL